jgi:hypothetical protein
MKTWVLISCVSRKLGRKATAEELYISPLFRLSLNYARELSPDGIFILSAKHGLLPLQAEIEPYNETLHKMPKAQVKEWADRVFSQLQVITDVEKDRFIFLAGSRYRKHLVKRLPLSEIPLAGLGIGKQLQWLKRATAR